MGHRSRISAILFDAEDSYQESARFWSDALGRPTKFDPDDNYTTLDGDLEVMVQHVKPGHQGMHIDIETDNVDAEVERLESLGARKKYRIQDWWVMEAPGGHAFCVVPVYSKAWPKDAVDWD